MNKTKMIVIKTKKTGYITEGLMLFNLHIRGISRCLNLRTSPHIVMGDPCSGVWDTCFIFVPACENFSYALTSAFPDHQELPFPDFMLLLVTWYVQI